MISITGTSGSDLIATLVVQILLVLLAGNDKILGGSGVDTLNGGEVMIIFMVMQMLIFLSGNADADKILGGLDNDTINGGAGDDDLRGELRYDIAFTSGAPVLTLLNGGLRK